MKVVAETAPYEPMEQPSPLLPLPAKAPLTLLMNPVEVMSAAVPTFAATASSNLRAPCTAYPRGYFFASRAKSSAARRYEKEEDEDGFTWIPTRRCTKKSYQHQRRYAEKQRPQRQEQEQIACQNQNQNQNHQAPLPPPPPTDAPTSPNNTTNSINNTTNSTTTTPSASERPRRSYLICNDWELSFDIKDKFKVEAQIREGTEPDIICTEWKANFHKKYMKKNLSTGADRIRTVPNAGGNSVWSEVLSFEILHLMFQAELSKTEMELEYWPPNSKITDFSVKMFDTSVGVSVTRALKFNGVFGVEEAKTLLKKKLFGVNESSRCVLKEHSWGSQILHVWAVDDVAAESIQKAWIEMDPELKSNTMVVVTVCKNADWIFFEYKSDTEM